MSSKAQRTVPYKDADEAFEAWWDSFAPDCVMYVDDARAAFLEGWAAHADTIREKAEPLSRKR